ncbi:3-hydroxybutyryl-CoA epimerase [Sphingobium chlorophenolicum L-1]|uniref:3-hydroxybutyryl-CoA epimerase n=1 Tax=Sphingobium chlorophenolicum L-1 TaxID=690566 RepID=F6EUI7_SPHCR|nr:3-hydroxyacyl-CoA dehydrogenase NAD-binding domain-containing protein [Sphingobium chlorophenolicum]AEG47881.1 3-hydroxybutyryl-CoA epimerase [Sphingobium chlorophenolicum L-1]
MENFRIELDADGIAVVTFDVPGRSMNTLTNSVIAEFPALLAKLRDDDAIKGVVFRSGKVGSFCAGADLGDLLEHAGTRMMPPPVSAQLRELELLGKPVAIALEGLTLGGGLELAMACHYRVAANSPKVVFGLPEVTIGLLPGGGGTQRLARLVGVEKALPLLLEGKPVPAPRAAELGIVDELAAEGEVLAAAKRWIIGGGSATARWDVKGYKIPGGTPYTPANMQAFMMAAAMLRKTTYGNFPAAENILKCVFEGIQLPIEMGLAIETRYFIKTFATPQARAMIRSLFVSRQALAKGGQWAGKAEAPKKVGVIGAGMMGAGIAYVQAARKIETVLLDVDQAAAEKGKGYSRQLVEKAAKRGRMTESAGNDLLDRITPSADYAQLRDVDLVVEAVFEDFELKHKVIRQVEEQLPATALFGSNTSTLPISSLAEASAQADNFIGIHFFSPVDRMDLVEIIRGTKTSEDAVARAVAYAVAIGKTPIVVNDSRGFYTSRCFGTYIYEGLEMLVEGITPALIENAGRMTSMPRGPLEISDDVANDLLLRVIDQTKAALGDAYEIRPFVPVIRSLVEAGRLGRKSGAGFYEYPGDGRKQLWSGLSDLAPVAKGEAALPDVEWLKTRLLHRQALEAARCFHEGVIEDPRAADVGAIMGWGFAAWTGGPLSYIDGLGTARFVAECDELAAKLGPRFAVPDALRAMAAQGDGYYQKRSKAAA